MADAQKVLNDAAAADEAKADESVRAAKEHLRAVKDAIKKLLDQFSQISMAVSRSASTASTAAKKKAKRPKAATLGAVTYQLAAGQKGTLQVPLSRSARNIVKRGGLLAIRQIVVSVGPSGKQTTKAKTVLLKRKRAKKAG